MEAAMAGKVAEGLVCVAQVATAHGIRGALKLRCFTEDPESVAAYGPLHGADGRELFEVRVQSVVKGGVVVRATGIADRNAAEALRGVYLYVPRTQLPEPDEDEFYHEDLIGLDVVDQKGTPQGEVVAIYNFGAGDVVEIRDAQGATTLIPFTRESVPEIDLEHGRVVIDPPAVS